MENRTRVLAGCTVRQDHTVLDWYLKSLKALRVPDDVELDFIFIDDNEDETSKAMLERFNAMVIEADPRPDGALYGVAHTHLWKTETMLHLGRQKQRLLKIAKDEGYDFFFLVDSDLILDPGTLESLLFLRADIASAVYWTRWAADIPHPAPQVWLRNPYELDGLGMSQHDFMTRLIDRQVTRVIGGGACCLFHTDVVGKARFAPPHTSQPLDGGGMWPGEDRTMSLSAQFSRIQQWADPWPEIYHAYHPEQRTAAALEEAFTYLTAPRQEHVTYGDLVSFTVESMEIARLQNTKPHVRCVRGRLGRLNLFPELEAALLDMEVGEERMIDLHYPHWFKVKELAGQKKMTMVHLLDVKPYGYAPVLSEYMFKGVE